ncbi:MAG: phosphate signaling complex protein PhoU [Verrucomicrobiota bacterium]
MELHIDKMVRHLHEGMAEMAKMTEDSFRQSVQALLENDPDLAKKIPDLDLAIDAKELELDQLVTEFIITENPLASDLRLTRVIGMVTTDLERIGDIAVRISGDFIDVDHTPDPQIRELLGKMCDHALSLLRDACNFQENKTEESLRAIIERDQTLNGLFQQFCEHVLTGMEKDPSFVRVGSLLLHTGYRIERVGDHAKHIAEDLIYLITAKDIRHEDKLAGDHH